MNVTPGGFAGRADGADYLALYYGGTAKDNVIAVVGVQRLRPVLMSDHDIVTVPSVPAARAAHEYRSVRRGEDRRPARIGKINAVISV